MHTQAPPVWRCRTYLVAASVLWSLSGLFTRLLQNPTELGLHEPRLEPMHLAVFRSLFAGLFFLPFLIGVRVRFRPRMLGMVACFAAMNALFLSAMAMGTAANAILLQNSAPIWVYLISVYLLGEATDCRSLQSIAIGMVGIAVILAGGLAGGAGASLPVMAMALGSGMTYAGVIVFLRLLRGESTHWLVLLNHLGAAVCMALAMLAILGPERWLAWVRVPTGAQLAFLAFFGVVQMAVPYWLFSRGLRGISPQEAGIITLLEPLLNPLWAYLIDPEHEAIPPATWVGGAILLAALVWRYLPAATPAKPAAVNPTSPAE